MIDVVLLLTARSTRILISFKSEFAKVILMTVESSSLIYALPKGGEYCNVYSVPVNSFKNVTVVTSKEFDWTVSSNVRLRNPISALNVILTRVGLVVSDVYSVTGRDMFVDIGVISLPKASSANISVMDIKVVSLDAASNLNCLIVLRSLIENSIVISGGWPGP